MIKKYVLAGVIVGLFVLIGSSSCQSEEVDAIAPSITSPDQSKEFKRLDALLSGRASLDIGGGEVALPVGIKGDIGLPASPPDFLNDPDTKSKYLTALRAYYIYRTKGLEHRSKVFVWQLFSAKIIFGIVLMLVVSGIYFAGVQFHMGIKQARNEGNSNGLTPSEFSASLKGIKVSSPVMGIIILSISLAFFYLYLIYVYPIEDIF